MRRMHTGAEDVEAETKDNKVPEPDGNGGTDLVTEFLDSGAILSPEHP